MGSLSADDWSDEDAAYVPRKRRDGTAEIVRQLDQIRRSVSTIAAIIVIYAVISLLAFIGVILI